MTTQISPSLGHGLLFTQRGDGASPGYDAIDFRRSDTAGRQEGVFEAGDYLVTQRQAGANMSVDIAAGNGAQALVQGDTVTAQGLYLVGPHADPVINEPIAAAHATLPRVDQVVLQMFDDLHDGSGNNFSQVAVLAGAPTSGATLDNRSGTAPLPDSCLLLADVLVGAGVASIANDKIRDRRTWARGALFNSDTIAGPHYGGPAYAALGLAARFEFSGVPVRVAAHGVFRHDGTDGIGYGANFAVGLDGSPNINSPLSEFRARNAANIGDAAGVILLEGITPGSHLIDLYYSTTVSPSIGLYTYGFTVEELVRQTGANNAVTSG